MDQSKDDPENGENIRKKEIMKTFAIHTLGCKVNSYESEAYIERCLELGYKQVDFKEKSDIYLINTCAVTNTATSKSRQKIHQAISQNPNAFIAVIGCYSQMQANGIEKMEHVNAIVGSDQKEVFLDQLDELVKTHQKINYVHDLKDKTAFEDLHIERFSHHTRAFLKIQDGCNQFCSYCIIPYTRGRERSLEENRVLDLAQRFVNNGHHEIVLSGIHTGRYGRDLNTDLTSLLKKMLEIEGLERIRISSIEMNEVTDELIELMKNDKRIARHLHIPVQSCTDSVLKRMNRPYDMKQFMERIDKIRQDIPHISISTDIIAGFADESEEEFLETIENVNKIQFSFMHVFPYSKRDKTVASKMNQIHGTIRKQRAKQLNEMSKHMKQNYYESWLNHSCEVLVEKYENGMCMGHSSEYIPVIFKGNMSNVGHVIEVVIHEVNDSSCFGSLEG